MLLPEAGKSIACQQGSFWKSFRMEVLMHGHFHPEISEVVRRLVYLGELDLCDLEKRGCWRSRYLYTFT
ncbi:hypothetical protein KR51_00028860 [Rubidibacter lacunae KORDI 51-2]|uniref:Uncharacterized protein n=1 Tax=Rubidibacter lacunae KORDI 51-2 TaxID=582515 RepID=U5DI67_9CHRO|nr:hypothetical protein KR51_00028860 [Rubidibacter lacunae KORDI 51-2]